MVCPKCGSGNIKMELRSAGTSSSAKYYRTGVKQSRLFPAWKKTYNSNRKHKTIALCKDCGHFWEVNTNSTPKYLTAAIGLLFIAGIISAIFEACTGPKNEVDTNLPIEAESIWASEITPLDNFSYYIDNDGIHLKDCNSREKKILVSAVYSYEERELPVISIEGGMFFNSADSIIISDGISKIDNASFNGCGVKYLYLPETITNFSGWSYFHNGEKLYYGGSEEQWSELYTGDRKNLDFIEVVCDANLEELLESK